MFIRIFYASAVALLTFFAVGFLLPPTVHVERSIEIARPASTVFTLLNGFTFFSAWSSWSLRDPNIVYEYSGPATGAGARMKWSGDPRMVGSGWQEITYSKPWSMIRLQLDFDQQGRANSYFRLDRTGSGVVVTWGFDTNLVEGNSFFGGLLARYFGLFFDHWVGSEYEQGLDRLKALAESLPATDFSDLEAEIVEVGPRDILYVTIGGGPSPGGEAPSLAAAFREIEAFMAKHSITMQAPRMAITRAWDARDYGLLAAIPASAADVEPSGNIKAGQSPSGRAVRVVHRGPYERMPTGYEKLAAYMAAHGLKEGRVSWEIYVSDPDQTPPGELVTYIYFLIGSD